MNGCVIIVDFRLKQGAQREFRRLVDANSVASMQHEEGCRRFDVIEPIGESDRVILYEIYDDEVSFAAHCRSAHFLSFDAASASLVQEKIVTRALLVCDG